MKSKEIELTDVLRCKLQKILQKNNNDLTIKN